MALKNKIMNLLYYIFKLEISFYILVPLLYIYIYIYIRCPVKRSLYALLL